MSKSIHCPYCHRFTHLDSHSRFGNQTGTWEAASCNACHKVVLIHADTGTISPTPLPSPVDERIPGPIRADFLEAKKCFSIGAFRASATMARRALQSVCLDKGVADVDAKGKRRSLQKQIDELLAQQIITKELQSWADAVHLVGNDAAHPKKPADDQPISDTDAQDILQLLEQFTQVLYVAPAIAAGAMGRRKSRNST